MIEWWSILTMLLPVRIIWKLLFDHLTLTFLWTWCSISPIGSFQTSKSYGCHQEKKWTTSCSYSWLGTSVWWKRHWSTRFCTRFNRYMICLQFIETLLSGLIKNISPFIISLIRKHRPLKLIIRSSSKRRQKWIAGCGNYLIILLNF